MSECDRTLFSVRSRGVAILIKYLTTNYNYCSILNSCGIENKVHLLQSANEYSC